MLDVLSYVQASVVGAFCIVLAFAILVCASEMLGSGFAAWWRRTDRVARNFLLIGTMLFIGYAGSKSVSIANKSASDDGITLTSATLEVTNDVARLVVGSTGGAPQPAWFREAVTNAWTLATDDGWVLVSSVAYDPPGVYTNTWERADTNGYDHASWYFGENPPPIEIVVTGGIEITGLAASGRSLTIYWSVTTDITLNAGSEVIVESQGSDHIWVQQHSETAQHGDRSVTFQGFWLDRKTLWRVRLVVLQ